MDGIEVVGLGAFLVVYLADAKGVIEAEKLETVPAVELVFWLENIQLVAM